MDDKTTIDFQEFAELSRYEMVETIDAYMVSQGIADNVRATITLLFGGVTAQTMSESGMFDGGFKKEMADLILGWLRDQHPDVLAHMISDLEKIGGDILRESDGS